MIAKDRGRKVRLFGVALAVGAIVTISKAPAQQENTGRFQVPPPAPRISDPAASKTKAKTKVNLSEIDVPGLQPTMVPVNPTDAIAMVNGQKISRQQLADECVAREGKKILELLIHRTLVEQALRERKLDVTAADIDQEIETVAKRFGISREGWLRTLDKERGISPVQYARDIIYPALALRKLCSDRVQVTPKDLQLAFEAQFGEKLRCRMILVEKQTKAVQIWEDLRKNPGGFEKMAQEQSMDTGSRSLGGLLAEPMTRHAYPTTISDAAFRQLIDGDPLDKDPSHKPKDGDFTGPIQADESAWIILRRESIIPAVKGADLKNEQVRKQTYEMIYEVKLKEAMILVFQELLRRSSIENQLTGTVKLANEEQDPQYGVDHDVKLMSNPPAVKAVAPQRGGTSSSVVPGPKQPPVGLSPEAAQQFESLNRPLRKSGTASTASSGSSSTSKSDSSAAASPR
jgi:foldase protein PrsA